MSLYSPPYIAYIESYIAPYIAYIEYVYYISYITYIAYTAHIRAHPLPKLLSILTNLPVIADKPATLCI